MGWTGPALNKKKRKEMDLIWALSPAGPTCVAKGVFGKNTPLWLVHIFYPFLL
jgi:hypothetical protein